MDTITYKFSFKKTASVLITIVLVVFVWQLVTSKTNLVDFVLNKFVGASMVHKPATQQNEPNALLKEYEKRIKELERLAQQKTKQFSQQKKGVKKNNVNTTPQPEMIITGVSIPQKADFVNKYGVPEIFINHAK